MAEQKLKFPTPTIEDYLGIIYTLNRDGEEVYGARLAELLNVSAPTVTVTLQRMVRDEWIDLGFREKDPSHARWYYRGKFDHPPAYADRVDAVKDPQPPLVRTPWRGGQDRAYDLGRC